MTVRKFIEKIIGNDVFYNVHVVDEAGNGCNDVNGVFEDIAKELRGGRYAGKKICPPFIVGHNIDVDRLDVLDFLEDRTRGQVERAKLLLLEAREAVATVWGRRRQIYSEWMAAGMIERVTDSGGRTDYAAIHGALFGDDYNKLITFMFCKLECMTAEDKPAETTGKQQTATRGRELVPFSNCFMIDPARRQSMLNTFHILIRGHKGRAVALVILAGIKAGIIQRPSFTAVAAEFGYIGSRAGYNRYVSNLRAFDTKEVESIVNVLQAVE